MSRIAVNMADSIPVTGVEELEKHLDDILGDSTLPLNNKLFDDVELQLTDTNIPPLIPHLLPKITEILKQYEQDPAVLCSLAIKLLSPLNFTQVLSMASEEALIQALSSPAPSANLLAITILEKATKSPGDTAILAALKNVITSFLTRWLNAPQVEVGEKASRVLGDLLDVDCDTRPPQGLAVSGVEIAVRRPPGQGFMWRRLFHDRDNYDLILSLCTFGPHQNTENGQTSQQVTLSQGRLLRLLPRLAALNLGEVTRTDFPELNERYGHIGGDYGILQFASLQMLDKSDLLMHLSFVDFFETLLSIQRITPFSTYKMETLRQLFRDATESDDILRKNMVYLAFQNVRSRRKPTS
ncbi:hypothetical protein GGR57DRAFT_205297 [Xylariaceae sp. FL1272]|nr:hypothetical protein GGR57DRAFT_205297 [Xylariaceae sp. FL1272]